MLAASAAAEGINMDSNTDQAKGRVKQAVADLTGDKGLRREGKVDEAAGKAKQFTKDVKAKGDSLIEKVKDKVTKD